MAAHPDCWKILQVICCDELKLKLSSASLKLGLLIIQRSKLIPASTCMRSRSFLYLMSIYMTTHWSNPERQDMSFTLFVLRVLAVYWYCKVSIAMLSFNTLRKKCWNDVGPHYYNNFFGSVNSSTDLSTLHWDFSIDCAQVLVRSCLVIHKEVPKIYALCHRLFSPKGMKTNGW